MSEISDLAEFFQGRTIGFVWAFERWTWRGPGYDEGWDEVSTDDLIRLHMLLGEHLAWERKVRPPLPCTLCGGTQLHHDTCPRQVPALARKTEPR